MYCTRIAKSRPIHIPCELAPACAWTDFLGEMTLSLLVLIRVALSPPRFYHVNTSNVYQRRGDPMNPTDTLKIVATHALGMAYSDDVRRQSPSTLLTWSRSVSIMVAYT